MKWSEKLTKYIDLFSEETIGEWHVDTEGDGSLERPYQLPFVVYSDLVNEFISDIYDYADQIGVNDYAEILKRNGIEWKSKSMSAVDVTGLSVDVICALLLGAVRAEKFCDGALLGFFESGAIKKWLTELVNKAQDDKEKRRVEMIGDKVLHPIFGEGAIKEVKDGSKNYQKYITVEFKSGDKKFVFPNAFENILSTDNSALLEDIKVAFDNIKAEEERERAEKEEKTRKALQEAEQKRAALEKSKGKKTKKSMTVISGNLYRGHYYGTSATGIFSAGCEAFAWDISESKQFGWNTPNYSDIATKEGYSVWFLAHSNWTATDNSKVRNVISETYIEQLWDVPNHPAATTRKRLVFAKKDNLYMFLGIYELVGNDEVRVRGEKTFYVERFNLVAEEYGV